MTIKDYFDELRSTQDFDRKYLALASGISLHAIATLLYGKREPTTEELLRLMYVLRVTGADLEENCGYRITEADFARAVFTVDIKTGALLKAEVQND